jgi:hypothetical protein
MTEATRFNVYDQFAGCFILHGLLALPGLSAGAKLCYAVLAQQANARGVTQLNLPLLAAALGELEGDVARRLLELEQVGLVEAARGNSNQEDVRIYFARPCWLAGTGEHTSAVPIPAAAERRIESQPLLFAAGAATARAEPKEQAQTSNAAGAPRRPKRRKAWYGPPRSRHSLATCLAFVTFQKEELGRRRIYNPEGLAESLYHTGKQDDEIADWRASQDAQDRAA